MACKQVLSISSNIRIDMSRELPDLWSEALNSLSDNDQQHFGFSQDDKRVALESLLQAINTEKENMVKSQLVIRRSHGKPIVLRDVFAKVVSCIDKFKSVGDAVTQYDPGHAALPWAAVRFILQAAISEHKIYEGMIEGVEQVADVIARYAWIETLYLHASSRMRTQLQNATTKLYVTVLKFLAKARRHYAKHTVQHVLKTLVQTEEQAVTKYLKAISDEEEKVNKIAKLIDAQYLREISKTMEGGFSSLLQRVGGLGGQIADLKLELAKQAPRTDVKGEDVIHWIDAVSTHDNYHTAKNARHRDTCDWIVQLQEFQDWLNIADTPTMAKVLWLHGKPGSGKTILSARIAEYLYEERPKSFALYFCFYGTENKRACNGIVRGWIAQILKDDDKIMNLAADVYKERDGKTATVHEIWHLFRLANNQQKPRYYLVDGFDECDKQEQNQPQHSLTDAKATFLAQMNETISGTGARVIIMSRPDSEIRDQLQLHSNGTKDLSWHNYGITLSDTSDDLNVFAAGVMDVKIPNRDAGLRQELAANVADKADGMFLWIKLLYGQFSRSMSPTKLRRIIADTPTGLDQAYERDLQNILALDCEERERAIVILRWTLYSFQPLTIKELAEALLVEFEDKDVSETGTQVHKYNLESSDSSGSEDTENSVSDNDGDNGRYLMLSELPDFGDDYSIAHEFLKNCGSLLELQDPGFASAPEDKTVHFVHFSVQEYLIKAVDSNPMELQGPQLSDRYHAHEKNSHICLKYLLYDDFRQHKNSTQEQFNEKIKHYAFLNYAGAHWGWHVNRCRPFSPTTINLSNDLLDPLNQKWLSYSEVVGGRANGSFSRFYARFKDNYPSPLFYASLWGIIETMTFLITERAQDVNHVGGLYGSPLKAAAAHGFEEAVRLLLDKGADIDLNGGQFGTAIQTAAAYGQIKVSKLLLECNPNVNLRGGWFDGTPLLAAAWISSRRTAEEMVRLLVQAGADVGTTDSKGATAMHSFAANGATSVLKVLVQNNASLDLQDKNGTTPLMLAIEEGRKSAVKFLVTSGANVNLKNDNGFRALHFACEQPQCMPILLDHGSEIDACDSKGATALHLAVWKLDISAVLFLVENGANLNIKDEEGMTVLHIVAGYCSDPLDEAAPAESQGLASMIIDLLLKYGADVEARDKLGLTPLHHCARVSNLQEACQFLDPTNTKECTSDLQWRDSLTLTESTIGQDSTYIMKKLLEYGADTMAKNNDGQIPLDVVGQTHSLLGDSVTERSSSEGASSDNSEKLSDDEE